ncbi:MAG: response regulator [Gammaproteobacteria bacterium]|jgi:CheY-like chemotaxis protein/Tfp pilus assembly protein PilF|nr:response regulator [Gammaproteobacteria bacterium]MBT7306935.1 response regulator [Gammaproteobacteria bacterium]
MDYSLKDFRFLIVDDFGNYRTSLVAMIGEGGVPGHQIDTASNGKDALNLLENNRYDVVLCDFHLGEGKDGQQVLEESRTRQILGYSTIFIMITAETARTMVLSVVENRPDDYLTKPFTRTVLAERLHRLVEEKEGLVPVDRALELKSTQRALHYLDLQIAKRTSTPMELLRIKAEILERSRHYDQSLAIYDQVLAEREMLWALLGRGRVLYSLQEYAGAVHCFEQVLEANDAYNVARDWMAKALVEMGEGAQAQKILEDAVEQSPKVLRRQKLLATVAEANHDLEVAGNAYEKTVRLGKHSLFRDVSDYTGYSAVLMERGEPKKALKNLGQARKNFAGDPTAQIETALQENQTYTQMGNTREADKALERASEKFEKRTGSIETHTALKLANQISDNSQGLDERAEGLKGLSYKVAQDKGEKRRAGNKAMVKQILSQVIQQNHDDESLHEKVYELAEQVGIEGQEKDELNAARKEVVGLNNEGVSYYRKGELDKAVEILYQAAERLSGNRVINLNAAQAILGLIVKQGVDEQRIRMLDDCLSRIPPEKQDEKYRKLHGLFEQFVHKLSPV